MRPAQRAMAARVGWLSRFCLALVLLLAALPKLRQPYAFFDSVFGYQIVSPHVALLVAMVVPWSELLVAACLLLGLAQRGACVVGALLGGVFVTANVWAVWHGLAGNCGCFGYDPTAPAVNAATVALSFGVFSLGVIGLVAPSATAIVPPAALVKRP